MEGKKNHDKPRTYTYSNIVYMYIHHTSTHHEPTISLQRCNGAMMIGSMLKQSTQLVQDFRMFPRCNSLFRMEVFPTSMTSLRTFALISMISEWQLIQVHVITLEDHWSIQENEEDMEMTWQKHPTAPFTCCNDGDLMYIINRLGTPFFFFPWLLLS